MTSDLPALTLLVQHCAVVPASYWRRGVLSYWLDVTHVSTRSSNTGASIIMMRKDGLKNVFVFMVVYAPIYKRVTHIDLWLPLNIKIEFFNLPIYVRRPVLHNEEQLPGTGTCMYVVVRRLMFAVGHFFENFFYFDTYFTSIHVDLYCLNPNHELHVRIYSDIISQGCLQLPCQMLVLQSLSIER